MHYYKFNIADWYLHTAHLSITEEAVYFRLVNHYYNTEKAFNSNETQSLSRRLRLASEIETVELILSEFFELKDEMYFHLRCEKEIKAFKKKAKVNKVNGAKGGRPQVNKGLEGNPEITQTVSEDNPDITLTTNHKPLTTNHKLSNKYLSQSEIPVSEIVEIYNEVCNNMPEVKKVTSKQKRFIWINNSGSSFKMCKSITPAINYISQ